MLTESELTEAERLGAEIERLEAQRQKALAAFAGRDGLKAAGLATKLGYQIAAAEKKVDRLLGWDQ